jgi:hypothetical protein
VLRSRPVFHHPLSADGAKVGAAIAARPSRNVRGEQRDRQEADTDGKRVREDVHEGILSLAGSVRTVVEADDFDVSVPPLSERGGETGPAPGFARVMSSPRGRRFRYSVKTVNGTTTLSGLIAERG